MPTPEAHDGRGTLNRFYEYGYLYWSEAFLICEQRIRDLIFFAGTRFDFVKAINLWSMPEARYLPSPNENNMSTPYNANHRFPIYQ